MTGSAQHSTQRRVHPMHFRHVSSSRTARRVLASAGIVGLALGAAACGSPTTPPPAPPAPLPAPTRSVSPSSPRTRPTRSSSPCRRAPRRTPAKQNVDLTVASGKQDGDDQGQITAIEDAIARGDKGILITPMSTGVNAAIKKARDAGLYVIALDTPPDPAEHGRHHLRHEQPRGRSARRQVGRVHARRQRGHHRPARPVQRQGRLRRLRPRPGLPRGHGHRRGRPEEER